MKLGLAATVGIVATAIFGALSAQEAKSQWDGVYTPDQATRGETIYGEQCSSCHGSDLTGGEMAPGLADDYFAANWNDLTLGDLFERIRISMPEDDPGSLSRQQNADVLAFILFKGKYPPGETELPAATEVLNAYTFLATMPQ